jgi:hypothetical protein
MDSSQNMTTLSQVMEHLRLKKKDNEFKLTDKGFSPGNNKFYQPEDLKIIRTYRFEGDTSPSDSCALYVIVANDGMTGYTLDAYGAYSNHDDDNYDELLRRIPVEDKENIDI